MKKRNDHLVALLRGKVRNRGSTLLVTVSTIVVLSFVMAHTCRVVTSRYRQLAQADAWHESISGAEAGADLAIVALRSRDWTGWQGPDANGARTFTMPALVQSGDESNAVTATIQVDSPPSFTTGDGVFYRIRSIGKASVPGGGRTGLDKYDNSLRRLSLLRDRDTGAMVNGGAFVSRTIEVIAKPSALFGRALALTNQVTSSSSQSIVDSYDSGDPAKSTNGLYDVTKRQSNADISMNDSTGANFNGMSVYGDVAYTGPAIPSTQGVQGTITTPFTQTILPIFAPTWTTVTSNFGPVSSNKTLSYGAVGSPTRYKMSSVKYTNNETLTISAPPAGTSGEVEVWITGDIAMAGSSQIIVPKGVRLTIWVEGDIKNTGGSFTNQDGVASSLIINGVTPANGAARSISLGGGAGAIVAVNAPAYDIGISGGGEFYGAFVGKSVDMGNNKTQIHYDEALGRLGGGPDYTALSFAEDVR